MRVAVDLGFGYVKVVNELNECRIFPSVVVEKTVDRGISGFFKAQPYEVTFNPGESAKSYYVGNAAFLRESNREWKAKFVENENLLPLIHTAVGLANDDKPVELVIGLPLSSYSSQRKELKKYIMENNECVVDIVGEPGVRKLSRTIRIENVLVLPQGLGAYYAATSDINGNVTNPELTQSSIIVIDIGQKTTDVFVLAYAMGQLTPREELSKSYPYGMSHFYKAIGEMLNSEVKAIEVTDAGIERAIVFENHMFETENGKVDLTPYEALASEALYKDIAREIEKDLASVIKSSKILIAGGGGNMLYKHFEKNFKNTIHQESGNFGNALGYLAAQAQMTKEKA